MVPKATFEDRDGVIWMDGQLIEWRDTKTHIMNHGLHYASSVFEGIRAYGGKIFKLTEHMIRFKNSAELMGFSIPYTVEELNQAAIEVIKKEGFSDCYIRPIAWCGGDDMRIGTTKNRVHTAIASWVISSWKMHEEDTREGIKMCISPWRRPSADSSPYKSKAAGLYTICNLARRDALEKGLDDALMLDHSGFIAEATGSNFFIEINNELHTPIPDCFLDGITRQTVIELAKRRGIKIIERKIKPEELANANGAFLTGTTYEITPIAFIDNYTFTLSPITEMMMNDYHKLVRGIL